MFTRASTKLITIFTFSTLLYLALAVPVPPATQIPVDRSTTHISRANHDYPQPLLESPLLVRAYSDDAVEMQHLTRRRSLFNRIRHTFSKVAKFGLAVAATGASALGRVSNVIPGAGKGFSSALKAISTGANAASNAIHVTLSAALRKGMGVLNMIRNPLSGAGGKVLNAILRREEGDWVL
jgi:hypothetical protein